MPWSGGGGRAHREAPDLVRRQRGQGEDVGNSLYCSFHGKELGDRVNRFRIDRF